MNTIINFHDVHDLKWFENIIVFLKSRYEFISMDELIATSACNGGMKKKCHITVDDGDRSFYTTIYPVLQKHGVFASIYVSPDAIIHQKNFWFQEICAYDTDKLKRVVAEMMRLEGDELQEYSMGNILKCFTVELIWEMIHEYRKRYKPHEKECFNMTLEQLLEIEKSPLITIGAHSMTHPILANESMQNVESEICNSMENLADILGNAEILCFAYPNGIPDMDFGEREKKILKQCGCKIAFSTETDHFYCSSEPLSFPRIGFSYGSLNFVKIKLFLGKNWEKLRKLKKDHEIQQRASLLRYLDSYF